MLCGIVNQLFPRNDPLCQPTRFCRRIHCHVVCTTSSSAPRQTTSNLAPDLPHLPSSSQDIFPAKPPGYSLATALARHKDNSSAWIWMEEEIVDLELIQLGPIKIPCWTLVLRPPESDADFAARSDHGPDASQTHAMTTTLSSMHDEALSIMVSIISEEEHTAPFRFNGTRSRDALRGSCSGASCSEDKLSNRERNSFLSAFTQAFN